MARKALPNMCFHFFFWLNREFDLFSKFGKIRHIRLYLTKFDTNTTPTIFIRRSQRKKIQIVTRKRTSGRESSRIGAINKAIKQLCCTVQNRIDFGMFRHCRRQDTLENTDKSRNVFVFFFPQICLYWIGLDWIGFSCFEIHEKTHSIEYYRLFSNSIPFFLFDIKNKFLF